MSPIEKIEEWLVYTGGICPAENNHFGGDPDANPTLNLKIQQRPKELARLIKFFLDAKQSGEILNFYAEIGACAGGTTRSVYEFLQFKEILIIDDGGIINYESYVKDKGDHTRSENLNFIPRIEIIGSSREHRVIETTLHLSKIHLYDILFIDGDHSYTGVKQDTINYYDIVREGGYFVFHDTAHINSIKKWLEEIPKVLPNLTFVEHIGESDSFTSSFPNGIGLTVYKKL